MLETAHRDGRARVLDWESKDHSVRTPALIVPANPLVDIPDWAQVVVTERPTGGRFELVPQGTWFHPAENPVPEQGLALPPAAPAPTAEVQVLEVDELAVFHDAGGWAADPSRLVPAFLEAARQATPARALWAPMLGRPDDYAIWAYLGVDLFDAGPLLLAAVRGEVLGTDGAMTLEEAGQVLGDGEPWSVEQAARHNLEAARQELARVRHAIAHGSLRALAERRAYVHPASVEVLRRFDREHAYLAAAAPTQRATPLPCMTQESLWMPEVEAFRRRVARSYVPPEGADVLVLLPCSARKPYRLSKSHRYFQRALDDSGIRYRVHEVMVTSPLGLVPRELEETYPARAYDVPVTGALNRDEVHLIRQQLSALLAHGRYRHVVVHTDPSTWEAVRDLVPAGVHTVRVRPASVADCRNLRDHLRSIRDAEGHPDVGHAFRARKAADVAALASFQFGPEAARALMEGVIAHGRTPYVKLAQREGNVQLGMTTPDRGVLSLTLDGARRVAPWAPRVHIQDFPLKKTKSLFAVGVEGAEDVRPGDEVVVLHRHQDGRVDLRGVGVAQMSGEEMAAMRRGVAVVLRHATPEPIPLENAPVLMAGGA